MKNLLIVTLYGNYNYGNKFQNYAMQVVLEKIGMNVCTNTNSWISQNNKNNVVIKIKRMIIKIINNILRKFKNINNNKRIKNFENFSNKYLNYKSYNTYEEIYKDFDIICIGSDQIWNPNYLNNFYYSYGQFSNNVFSYAASFGIEKIPDKYKNQVKEGLEHVKYISVREEKGADIVERVIGKRPEVLVDPTLLLTDKEWDKIIKIPKKFPKKKFILTYFLGDYSNERKDYINTLARNANMEVVNLAQIEDKKYYFAGPSEFLYYIKNCEMMITDSYHGSVFSILYKKPFYVMNREGDGESMNSRIETLLRKFNLNDRVIENYTQELKLNCDFNNINTILDVERKKSMEFLKKALDMEENNRENKSN